MAYRQIHENRWERFKKRITVDPDTGCWNWEKVANYGGYGVSSLHGVRTVAHRAVWQFLRGDIPEGMDLDHLCRNRQCVNPDHLEPVTRSENLTRGFEARGCINGHPYDPAEFSIVHHSSGKTQRRCKICHRARNKLAKARKRERETSGNSLRP